ncbi:MAG: nitrous oxide reductase family maturation protein NosD, partial [Alphaproteobacteria bacterium]|nr:nitrous oxide reductase family maturation protein NosD [Alphaproteobacteria bacterium]
GRNPGALDSGILAESGATGVVIEDNQVDGNLFGISLQGPKDARVRNNRIHNRSDLRLNERGNGINVWNTTGAIIEGNQVRGGRDGLFITTANGNVIHGNRFEDVRFAVHYMYANDNEISDNVSIGNHVGYALMFSNNLKIYRNVSLRDRDHGLMIHTCYRSDVADNYIRDTEDKCVFIYTAAQNKIHGNRFEGCGTGIHFTGGSEDNKVYENAFINNRTQVKYPGMVSYEWSYHGRGNYWSDNPAFDLKGNGIADVAYHPNDILDRVMWKYPTAKLLLSSPALVTLRAAQSQFPAISPGGVVDSAPLMKPPSLSVALPPEGSR